MLEQTFVRQGIIDRLRRGPLGPHLDHFATSLHHQGYVSSRGLSRIRAHVILTMSTDML
jgi:hypothetical protein